MLCETAIEDRLLLAILLEMFFYFIFYFFGSGPK